MKYNNDNVSRLAGFHIERNPTLAEKGVEGYEEAVRYLQNLRLVLICGYEVSSSKALQAALITSVNSGKRAFKGGVTVVLTETIPFLLPWHRAITLNEVIIELGGQVLERVTSEFSFALHFGEKATDNKSLQVVCNGWQGGVCTYKDAANIDSAPDFALGGVLAGALAVGLAFLKVTGEKPDACNKSIGLSLWHPGVHWLSKEAKGPEISYLPQKYWFVGLGHLGQAFVWTLSLFQFSDASKVTVYLQDSDLVSESNFDTGMLSERSNVKRKKTRVCSDWLESRKFSTSIIERKFDSVRSIYSDEPIVLIRGLDSAKARKEMQINNFKHTIDCGIGGTKSDFDSIAIYNFPECGKDPSKIWDVESENVNNRANERAMSSIGCGLYGKAISTSFVGAFASTLVLGELVRSGYGGIKSGEMSFLMRDLFEQVYVGTRQNYTTELVENGYI